MSREDKMGSRVKDFYKRYTALIWGFLFPFLLLEGIAILMKVQPFGNQSFMIVDALHQYVPFFADYQEKLKSLDSMFYSFHGGLGYNFLGLWAYYLSSPLNLLIALFPKDMLNLVLSQIYILKLSLCGFTGAYFFYKRGNKKDISIVVFGLAYALSSYMVGYSWNIMWLEVMMLLPLIILGMERLLENGDGRLYCIALFFSLYCNFYMSFMTCFFLILWFFLYRHKSIKGFFINGIRFAFHSIVSAMMAAAVLIPTYLGIMKTSSAKWDFPKEKWYGNFADLLYRHFVGTKPLTNSVFDGDINLYCGILTLVFVIFYFFSKKISLADKIRRGILVLFLFVSFNSPFLGYIWHGFHNQYGIPNRFAYLYIFVLLMMAYDSYLIIQKMDTKDVWQLGVSVGILCGIIALILKFYTKEQDQKVLVLTIVTCLVYFGIFILQETKVISIAKMLQLCCIVFLVEITGMAIYGFSEIGQVDVPTYFEDTKAISEAKEDMGTGIETRSELAKGNMLDESIWHTLNGVTLFGSTAQGTMVDIMDDLGFYTGVNEYLYEGATPFTDNLFSVQYQLYRPDDTEESEFYYYNKYDNVTVYKNPYETAIGYGMSLDAYDWDYDSVDPYYVQNDLIEKAWKNNHVFQMVSIPDPQTKDCTITKNNEGEYIFENTASVSDNLTFTIPVTEDGKMYMHFDGSQVEDTVIYKNGNVYVSGRLNAQCVYLGELSVNDHIQVQMKLKEDDVMSGVVRIKVAQFDEEAFKDVYASMIEHKFKLESSSSGKIQGTIEMEDEGMVFFSIPYDKGWTAYVDGKKVETKALGNAFLTVPVIAGKHEIRLVYQPEGFSMGVGLSVAGILIFAFLCIRNYKKEIRKK